MSNPRQVTVNVTLNSVDPITNKGNFSLQPVGPDPLPPPTGSHQVLKFENCGHDGVDIDFVLTDATCEGYTFPSNSDKRNAVSSVLGATDLCPLQGTLEVLNPISVSGSDNTVLRVHNPNQKKITGPFSYVLWVTKDDGSSYVPLDPGGVNMNGSTGRFSLRAALVVTGIAGAAVVLAGGVLSRRNIKARSARR